MAGWRLGSIRQSVCPASRARLPREQLALRHVETLRPIVSANRLRACTVRHDRLEHPLLDSYTRRCTLVALLRNYTFEIGNLTQQPHDVPHLVARKAGRRGHALAHGLNLVAPPRFKCSAACPPDTSRAGNCPLTGCLNQPCGGGPESYLISYLRPEAWRHRRIHREL